MSYDISIIDPETKQVVVLSEPHQMKGGTYALGGTPDASLNITYNYGGHFQKVFGEKGIRFLYGMKVSDSIELLNKAIGELGDDVSENYWEATEGNARRALIHLKELALLAPHGIWDGD